MLYTFILSFDQWFQCCSCQPEELTACFLKAAEANTIKTLETCGLIFGALLMDPEVCFFLFFSYGGLDSDLVGQLTLPSIVM